MIEIYANGQIIKKCKTRLELRSFLNDFEIDGVDLEVKFLGKDTYKYKCPFCKKNIDDIDRLYCDDNCMIEDKNKILRLTQKRRAYLILETEKLREYKSFHRFEVRIDRLIKDMKEDEWL